MNDGGIRRSKTYAFPQIHESTPTYPAVPPEEELRADRTASAQHTTKGPQKDGEKARRHSVHKNSAPNLIASNKDE